MPDKKKKKGLLTVPPELQEYIKGGQYGKFPSFKAGLQGYEKWGAASPSKTYDYWKQNDPYGLYMIQLDDYLAIRMYPQNFPEIYGGWDIPKPMSNIEYKDIMNEVENRQATGMPVESMPFYKDVSRTIGRNFEEAYKNMLISEYEVQKTEAITRSKTLRDIKSSEGRFNLQDYINIETQDYLEMVAKGRISAQEAQGAMSELINQAYGEKSEYGKFKAQQISEALRNVYSREGRQKLLDITQGKGDLADLITKGDVTARQAYGVGSEWEKWQHEEVEKAGGGLRGVLAQQTKTLQETRQAQEAGAKKATDLQTQQMKQSRLLGMLYPEEMARYQAELRAGWGQVGGTGGAVTQMISPETGGVIRGDISGIDVKPGETYKEIPGAGAFTGETRVSGGTYIPPNFYIQGFADWAKTNPEFQKARATKESQMWTDFPTTYPAYQSYMQAFQPTGLEGQPDLPLTFEKWGQEDVEGKLLSEAEETRKRAASLAAKGRLAPLTVNR